MNTKRIRSESGQTLVLVVLGILAFIAVLALVLDGGNAYATKRQAQNAADAGALAGAQYMCQHRNEAGARATAIQKAKDYAGLNGADNYALVNADLNAATVVVTATVTKNTFFAGLIGFNQVSPRAVAEAECRPPAVGVLPVAWSCRENVMGATNCDKQINPDPINHPYDLNYTYILMDSVKVKGSGKCIADPLNPGYCQNDIECSPQAGTPPNCQPTDPSKIDCDLNNDCVDELMTGGARSWLDLNGGGGGANELKNWISGAVDPPMINAHTWLPEESGVATSIFQTAAASVVGKVVILPVFNKVCSGMPTNPSDPETAQACNYWWGATADTRDNLSVITGSTLNFHVISFSAFHVTCVQTGSNQNSVTAEPGYIFMNNGSFVNHGECNGHFKAACLSPDPKHPQKCVGVIDDNSKTIEGYFVRDNLGGFGGNGDWIDMGAFTVVLVK